MNRNELLNFDQAQLRNRLASLPSPQQVAFAASAASRQLNSLARVAWSNKSVSKAQEVVAKLWTDVLIASSDRTSWEHELQEVMSLLPHEDDDNVGPEFPFLDDAITSLAYAIRCFLTSDPWEAAWAAQRAYEATDQAAIRVLSVHPADPQTEELIRSHPIVQRELQRQDADLDLLEKGQLAQVKSQAADTFLLTAEEVAAAVHET